MQHQPFIAVTPGDINGIGPETIIKALEHYSGTLPVLLLAPLSTWQYYARISNIDISSYDVIQRPSEVGNKGIFVLDPQEDETQKPDPGQLTAESGKISFEAVELATDLCLDGLAGAMVTGPISKEAVNLGGFEIQGHTEYLAMRDQTKNFAMMLISGVLRVVPLTTHIPLANVPQAITPLAIYSKLDVINRSLKNDFLINHPRIAILGLNPHAGDGGVIGKEEIEIITPAIETSRKTGYKCDGPFAADGFFATRRYVEYDAVVAMYHDQGLIPFKTIAFNQGVNYTAGLSFVRTSPDHGTAFGMAGKNKASHGSMLEALNMAAELAVNKV